MVEQRARRWRVWAVAVVLAASTLVILVLVGAWLMRPLVVQSADRRLTELSVQLDRSVTADGLDLDLLAGAARLRGLEIGPGATDPEDAPAALRVESVRVKVALWETLLSWGRGVELESVAVESPRVDVVRYPGGGLNWTEIADSLRANGEGTPEDESPRTIRVGRIEMRGGHVSLRTGSAAGSNAADTAAHTSGAHASTEEARISNVHLVVRDFSTGGEATFALGATLLGESENLTARGRISGAFPWIDRLSLQLSPTPLGPLAPYLASLMDVPVVPERGVLGADVDVSKIDTGEQRDAVAVQAEVTLSGARFAKGQPFAARAVLRGEAVPEEGLLHVEAGRLEIGEMSLVGEGRLTRGDGDSAPRAEDLRVRSEGLSFERLRTLYPPLDEVTAPVVLRGPFAVRMQSGDAASRSVDLDLDLSGARVTAGEHFAKPMGTSLRLAATVVSGAEELNLSRLHLDVAGWEVTGTGVVSLANDGPPEASFSVHTSEPRAAGLVRLFSAVTKGGGAAEVEGTLALLAKVRISRDEQRAQGSIELSGFDLHDGGVVLVGDGSAQLDVSRGGETSGGEISADLTDARAVVPRLLDKPRGVPLELKASWRRPEDVTKGDFAVRLATLHVNGEVTVQDREGTAQLEGQATIPSFAVRPLLAVLPAVRQPVGEDVRVSATVRLSGDPTEPASVQVELPHFEAIAARSHLQGSMRLHNLEAPEVTLRAQAPYLNVEDFVPLRRDEPAAETDPPPRAAKSCPRGGRIALQIAAGRASGMDFHDLTAELRIANCRAVAETLEVDVFGGHVSASGTELTLSGPGGYRLRGDVARAELPLVLQRFAGVERLFTGTLGASFDLTMSALDAGALKESLTGRVSARVDDAVFLPGNGFGALVERLAAVSTMEGLTRSLQRSRGAAHGQPWALNDLEGELRFDGGAVAITRPFSAVTPQGRISVEGAVGLDGAADLEGTFSLQPEAIEELLSLHPDNPSLDLDVNEPIPIPFRVHGSLQDPQFAFGDLRELALPLARAYAKAVGGERVRRGLGGVLEDLPEDVPVPDDF